MKVTSPITVVKASGEKEPFSEEKIILSLTKSGLSKDTAVQTVDYLKTHLKQDMTTKSIFGHVSNYLEENAPIDSFYNYGLKRAVMDMGPSGYPFEILISDLLRLENYKTEVGVVTQGKCVTHEVDVIAQKGNEKFFVECKYHNSPGYKTDIQVALYTYARFLDINASQLHHNPEIKNTPWLISNTKVTSEVVDYSRCVNLMVTTWSYPDGQGLQDRIVAAGLHPVTLLTNIPRNKIKILLDKGYVTCVRLKTAILNNEISDILDQVETSVILKNISSICKNNE
jgi:hypothetical protein